MGDVVESMLRKAMAALMTNDRQLAAEVSRMDNIVDRLDEAIKLYVTKVTRESLDDRDGRCAGATAAGHARDLCARTTLRLQPRFEPKNGAAEVRLYH